ncbi:hypothetical protein EV401DRAFT_2093454 [Pisolithus croceorrhizus]|nr:hypothetical protein EV401DRAFT_2093454 [Pisolithus croceorrhizus]
MPPASTKPKLKHKPSRGDHEELEYDRTRARETEQKRIRGQMSCAECTRLKIKCDKRIPCQSCRRRRCVALCPNGSLSTGLGTRSVLAATEPLYHRINELSERIQQLEGALSEFQALHSTEPHPLLLPDPFGASQPEDDAGPPSASDPVIIEHPPDFVEVMGTLSVSDSGASRFFGPTAGSHIQAYLITPIMVPFRSIMHSPKTFPELPQEIENLTAAFPFKPAHSTLNMENLVNNYLPTWQRALHLTEAYIEQTTPLFQSVSRDQILNELLPAYYVNGVPHVTQVENPHQLGLLFVIFATAALLDPNQEPGSAGVEAEAYHKAARAAICLRSVMQKPFLETIQVLHLLSVYNAVSGNELAGKETSMETSWSLVVLAAHLAHTVNRDGLRLGMPADITARRRMIFWDLFVADVWNCLEAGRPPTFSLPYIDCQFPGGGSPNDKVHIGTDRQGFCRSWAFRFASSRVADVAARALASDPPSYSTILKLDRQVRDFPVPEAAENFAAAACDIVPAKPADSDIGLMESMIRFVMSNAREILLLYLHRSYFVQAIIENPINPLNSPYTLSFLAAYRASLTILRTVRVQYDLHPKPIARLSPMWTSAFSATVVFGTIVTRGPRSPMASSAMKELHDACLLFSKVSSHSRRAQKALPIITRLTEKAQNALLHARGDMPYELGQQWCVTDDEGDKDVAIFAGRTKILPMRTYTTDGMLSTPALVSQDKQNQVEAVALQPYSGEELLPVEPMVPQAYSGEKSGSTWFQRSGSAAGLEQTQERSTWDRVLCTDVPSNSTLTQPPVPLQISPYVPLRASEHGELATGSSTSAWPLELSDPYTMANVSTPCALAHPRGFRPSHDRYDQHEHCPPASSALSTVSYYDDQFASAGAHHHQSRPQSHPSTHSCPHSPPHLHYPTQPPPWQYQSTHSDPPQSQIVPLSPPELAQFCLVAQESVLDQRWVSFMRESGFLDG